MKKGRRKTRERLEKGWRKLEKDWIKVGEKLKKRLEKD